MGAYSAKFTSMTSRRHSQFALAPLPLRVGAMSARGQRQAFPPAALELAAPLGLPPAAAAAAGPAEIYR